MRILQQVQKSAGESAAVLQNTEFIIFKTGVGKPSANTTATSFTHNKLKSETKYTYTVRCLDSKGNFASGYDKNGTSNIFLNPPKISSLANINGGVEIKWNTLKDADSYRVTERLKYKLDSYRQY